MSTACDGRNVIYGSSTSHTLYDDIFTFGVALEYMKIHPAGNFF